MKTSREIKFRAQKSDKGQRGAFVYGDWFQTHERPGRTESWIIEQDSDGAQHLVYPETLGQFTGLHDKNGKDVYEGDKIRFRVGGAASSDIEGIVSYEGYYFGAVKGYGLGNLQDIEVIGNVYEN